MKTALPALIFIFSFNLTASAEVVIISNSNSATVETDVSATASTGGNSAGGVSGSSGGSVHSGDSKSVVRVKNSNDGGDDETEIEIETERGFSSVNVRNSSVSTGTSPRGHDEDDEGTAGIEIELEEKQGQFFLEVDGEELRIPENSSGVKIEVRGWDSREKKVSITAKDVKDSNDFEDLVKAIVFSDKSIENVDIDEDKIEIGYSQKAKLFGFIPWALTSHISLDSSATSTKQVKVNFPWYHFFFTKDVDLSGLEDELKQAEVAKQKSIELSGEFQRLAAVFEILTSTLKTRHDTVKNSIGNIR